MVVFPLNRGQFSKVDGNEAVCAPNMPKARPAFAKRIRKKM
jgi:hypothetical protein